MTVRHTDTDLENLGVALMAAAGIDPAKIYAFQQTGVMITEANRSEASSASVYDWSAAVARHRTLHRRSVTGHPSQLN
jgi:phosphoglycerate dehydrogenase-like enzyme